MKTVMHSNAEYEIQGIDLVCTGECQYDVAERFNVLHIPALGRVSSDVFDKVMNDLSAGFVKRYVIFDENAKNKNKADKTSNAAVLEKIALYGVVSFDNEKDLIKHLDTLTNNFAEYERLVDVSSRVSFSTIETLQRSYRQEDIELDKTFSNKNLKSNRRSSSSITGIYNDSMRLVAMPSKTIRKNMFANNIVILQPDYSSKELLREIQIGAAKTDMTVMRSCIVTMSNDTYANLTNKIQLMHDIDITSVSSII